MCNNQLGTQGTITKQDIANVSRMRNNTRTEVRSSMPMAMIIKFQNERARNYVFSNKKKLKGTGKVISEFLTIKKSALLKECHDKIPGTFAERSIWTHYGKILIKKRGDSTTTHEIKSTSDIGKFLREHQLTAREVSSHSSGQTHET